MNSYLQHCVEGLKPRNAPDGFKLMPEQQQELIQVFVNQLSTDIGVFSKFLIGNDNLQVTYIIKLF